MLSGLIWDIRKYSLHDGPGIRTTVFLKGCPLACRWCCNPESQAAAAEVCWLRDRCQSCGTCLRTCGRGAVSVDESGRRRIDRARCDGCGDCAEGCLAGAMIVVGRQMSVDDVLVEVERDAIFHSRSGGGLTLSGGEPLAQAPFAAELLRRYKSDSFGSHTSVETCGEADWGHLALLVPHVDLFLYDIKHMDPAAHCRTTGVDNGRILENARRLAAEAASIIVRLPLIPGVNDDEENVRRTAQFARSVLRVDRVDVLPYHRLGEPKYSRLDRRCHLAGHQGATTAQVAAAVRVLEDCGLRVRVGG